jgi:hypothetical protein
MAQQSAQNTGHSLPPRCHRQSGCCRASSELADRVGKEEKAANYSEADIAVQQIEIGMHCLSPRIGTLTLTSTNNIALDDHNNSDYY